MRPGLDREAELPVAVDGPLPVARALREASASSPALRGLVARGLARIEKRWSAIYLVEGSDDGAPDRATPDPTAWSQIKPWLRSGETAAMVVQGDESDRWPLYAAAIQRIVAAGRQALVVAPDALTAADLARWLAARSSLTVADTSRARTPAQRVSLWRSLRAGEVDLLVGTRDATFAPLTRLGLIVVERDEDAGHKTRVAPRYHVPVCATKLAELFHCPLLLGTETPRMAISRTK